MHRPGKEVVAATTTDHIIIARPSKNNITVSQSIAAEVITPNAVIAPVAIQNIRSGPTVDPVSSIGTVNDVISRPATDHGVPRIAGCAAIDSSNRFSR